MKRYVLGFVFDMKDRVLLVEKNRPDWQVGFLNGLGGHVEHGESPLQAMAREGGEETAGKLARTEWKPYGRLRGPDFEVWLFYVQVAWAGHLGLDGISTEEGVCSFEHLEDLPGIATVPNLEYLVVMAKTSLRGRDRAAFYEIVETTVPEEVYGQRG